MNIKGQHFHSIWLKTDDVEKPIVQVIDQRFLPHRFVIEDLRTVEDAAKAIKEMHVRGAPLIGATAAFGMYFAVRESADDAGFENSLNVFANQLKQTRPTAVNLFWAVEKQLEIIASGNSKKEKENLALENAQAILIEDVSHCKQLGAHAIPIIEAISKKKKGQPVNILTHCNAGWLACVDYGTATSPIYQAHDLGIDLHVWVDETRPRNQGARLTAWELAQHGVPHTVIPDNTGGHLMQHGLVDMVIVGTDRTTSTGDVANKIGTYLKALAAKDNDVPFYVALPSSTFDFSIENGLEEIPIEQRNADEVKYIQGLHDGDIKNVLLTPRESPVANYAFDVTPARLVSGLITERGICEASKEGIKKLFPEHYV